MSALGRRKPTDWQHVDSYPLAALRLPPVAPVVLGIDWYTNFDHPMRSDGTPYAPGTRGLFWIGRGSLGKLRGGHCICAKPYGVGDGWWDFYNQLSEGACVGEGCARGQSLLNRCRYDAPAIYHEAQQIDEYADTPPAEGTSVRAGLEVLRTKGAQRVVAGSSRPWNLADGITAYRWATSWDEVRATLNLPGTQDGVPLLNSWGRDYPHIVHLTDEAGALLLSQDGEAGVVTDR